jgi:predicted RNA-binding protein with PUA-like domain
MPTFLLKTEPSDFSFAELQKKGSCRWDGVANAAALIAIRTMKKGDFALIYHTGDEKAIVGLAKVTRDAYADPAQPGTTSTGQPKFAVVDLAPIAPAKTPVTLSAIKADPRFKGFALVTQARLSAMLVPATLDAVFRKLAGLPAEQ